MQIPRPGHADFTYLVPEILHTNSKIIFVHLDAIQAKYGVKAESGGGRSSARETVARVCAGALCKEYLQR